MGTTNLKKFTRTEIKLLLCNLSEHIRKNWESIEKTENALVLHGDSIPKEDERIIMVTPRFLKKETLAIELIRERYPKFILVRDDGASSTVVRLTSKNNILKAIRMNEKKFNRAKEIFQSIENIKPAIKAIEKVRNSITEEYNSKGNVVFQVSFRGVTGKICELPPSAGREFLDSIIESEKSKIERL